MKTNIKVGIIVFFVSMGLFMQMHAAKRKLQVKPQKTQTLEVEIFNSVEELMQSMSLEQKIAQLMVVRSFAENDSMYYTHIADAIGQYQYGGLCFFKGLAPQMVKASNLYQRKARIPLLISIDGEWGPAMRLTDVWSFPREQTLGALQNDSLIYKMGCMVGQQCKRLGIHFNYIPTVDINNNPNNPVINTRSFGEDKYKVAEKGLAYFNGMHGQGVLGSAKHFPGHGDTDTDSHLATPTINHTMLTIDTLDLYPFKKMIEGGVNSIMVGHLRIPAIDTSRNPASLSSLLIDTLLRKTLGFDGLVFTDGLEMTGVTSTAKYPGEVEVRALLAGNDILLLPLNPPASITAIKKAVEDSILSIEKIENSCRRILNCKKDLGLLKGIVIEADDGIQIVKVKEVSTQNLLADLNTEEVRVLNRQIFAEAITLLKNKDQVLPFSLTKYTKVACLHLGDTLSNLFEKSLSSYAEIDHYYLHRDFSPNCIDSIKNVLAPYDLLLIAITNTNHTASKGYGITPQTRLLIDSLQALPGLCALSLFASPYALNLFPNTDELDVIMVAYQELPEALMVAPQILFGGLPALGRLPVSVNEKWPLGSGLSSIPCALSYKYPQELGLDTRLFTQIDSLALLGIKEGAYPGCQIAIAKNGSLIYQKAFGHHTYDSTSPLVSLEDVYDVASLTKIVASTLAMMKLYDEEAYHLDDKLSASIHRLRRSNKKNITMRALLSHQAGLKPSVVVYKDSLYKKTPVFSRIKTEEYSLQLADSLYVLEDYDKRIRELMDESNVETNPQLLYSDVGFYYLKEYIEKETDVNLDVYVSDSFYKPLGLHHISYLPLQKWNKDRIVPTENDRFFRKQQLQGFVHDPTVAMMGGVGGAAGVFSNAHDLVVIGQMLMQHGQYGGHQYIDSATVSLFTSSGFSAPENRRGGGFDKPALRANQPTPTAVSASPESYGHSGFTGTYMWIDPKYDLVYVFLSNRVCPDAENKKLVQMNLRTDIQELIYKYIKVK